MKIKRQQRLQKRSKTYKSDHFCQYWEKKLATGQICSRCIRWVFLFDWLRVRGNDRTLLYWADTGDASWCEICVCASVLATNGQVDGGEVILEGSSRGKHLVFIRHRGQEQAGRWWWSLYTIEKSSIPPTSAPQTSTHRACLKYALNINPVVFHDMDI